MSDTKAIARESFRLIEAGDPELAKRIIAPDFVNQESEDDPEDVERQQHGPPDSWRPVGGYAMHSRICASNSRRPSRREAR
jgi:hypothetical protein